MSDLVNDKFAAGQVVGALAMIEFFENNDNITEDMIMKIKMGYANSLQEFFGKPSEDILLMIKDQIKDI